MVPDHGMYLTLTDSSFTLLAKIQPVLAEPEEDVVLLTQMGPNHFLGHTLGCSVRTPRSRFRGFGV